MLKNSHALIKREWISNKDNEDKIISTEGCIINFSKKEAYDFFPMDDSPIVDKEKYTLEEEYILFMGFKIHFCFTQENNHLILDDNDLNILFENQKNN